MSSSIFAVAIGSSAEVGSSNSRISGLGRERAGDAQTLLLAARQAERRVAAAGP